jgi:glyoxylase-like metal-dependent hydrolase (beta-lactamase superfamily II)
MQTKIHTYTSAEPMLKVNAFIVEAAKELVIVDTTLTMSDSKALKQLANNLNKPIAAILLTHGHPDHIAGTYNIATDNNIPVYALASVNKLMQETEEAKHKQWSGMFGEEWIPKWIYPNQLVRDNETINAAGLNFTVIDIGAGGDCDANSFWLLDDDTKSAFIGDFVYNNNHTYMNDGNILRWLANIESYSPLLKEFDSYYIGHGAACNYQILEKQKEYFITYCSSVLKATNGSGVFTEETRKQFEETMLSKFPDYGCQFMIGLSADRVAKELLNPNF